VRVLNEVLLMFLLYLIRYALYISVPISLILTSYLYLYPVFHLCAFPSPELNARSAYTNTLWQHALPSRYNASKAAPFRLLALGDPQLEGDSSIDFVNSVNLPHFWSLWENIRTRTQSPLQRLRHGLHDLVDFYLDDIPKALNVYRKRLDHVGNDYYLGHIYRTMHWWTDPTHVTALGDLVGSQWIDDKEFENRGRRFWNRVFKHGERVPDEVALSSGGQDILRLGDDPAAWKRRIINVAGNHDIGYAGDISRDRLDRFERVFGKPNYELRFQLPINYTGGAEENVDVAVDKPVPELRIIVINDMNLDTPVSSQELQTETYEFLNKIITTSQEVTRPAHFTLVLTHIPMHKQAGICVDAPFFDFFTDQFNNGVKEQNHLSVSASKGFLEGVFGMSGDNNVAGKGLGRYGTILTGHDHEGCDIYHYINQSAPLERYWEAKRWGDVESSKILDADDIPGMREITVRSMMGDFAGNAGLMSLWFDEEIWDWKFDFVNCSLGTQHIWWTVHIWVLVNVILIIVYVVLATALRFRLVGKAKKVLASLQSSNIAAGVKVSHVATHGGEKGPNVGPNTDPRKDEIIAGTNLEVPGAG